ncbi:ABC transporter permease, partial [Vibrio parahaemolyticus]|nr:ABC transporter permease [Vibrio parahaemolyticus]
MSQVAQAPSMLERFKQSDFLYYFKRDKVAMTSFGIFMLCLLLALAAPLIAPT